MRYNEGMKHSKALLIVRWMARILAVAFILFISIFALDVFSEENWLLPLLIHLIPSFILTIITAIAWKYERLGGLIFLVAGALMLISSRFESLIVSTPAIVIGGLFLVSSILVSGKHGQSFRKP